MCAYKYICRTHTHPLACKKMASNFAVALNHSNFLGVQSPTLSVFAITKPRAYSTSPSQHWRLPTLAPLACVQTIQALGCLHRSTGFIITKCALIVLPISLCMYVYIVLHHTCTFVLTYYAYFSFFFLHCSCCFCLLCSLFFALLPLVSENVQVLHFSGMLHGNVKASSASSAKASTYYTGCL